MSLISEHKHYYLKIFLQSVLKLKTCGHTLCMNCADKAPLVDDSSENEENLQKCPLLNCFTKFPKECLEYYMQQLKSNMQMVRAKI